MDQMMS